MGEAEYFMRIGRGCEGQYGGVYLAMLAMTEMFIYLPQGLLVY